MIRTRLTDRFGIKHPILCAPMAYVTGGALAAAVSRAGGLGIVGGAYAGTMAGEPETRLSARSARYLESMLRHVLSTIFKPKRSFAERLWVFSEIAPLLNQS